MGSYEVSLACPRCGQRLSFPTLDLRAVFACPRCGTQHQVGALVQTETTLPAIPVLQAIRSQAEPGAESTPAQSPRSELIIHQPTGGPEAFAPHGAVRATTPVSATPSLPMPAVEPDVPLPSPAAENVGSGGAFAVTDRRGAAAMDLARASVAATSSIAERFDAWLWGKRKWFVGGCALLVFVAQELDPFAYAVALVAFAFVLYLLLIARVLALRDDDGGWSVAGVLARLVSAVRDAFESVVDWSGTPFTEVARRLSVLLATTGLVFTVLAPPVKLLFSDFLGVEAGTPGAGEYIESLQSVGPGMLTLATVAFLLWRFRGGRKQVAGEFRDSARAVGSGTTVPPVLDIFELSPSAVASLPDAGLRRVLEILKTWKPRKLAQEADYRRHLARHLRKRMPAAVVDTEVRLLGAENKLVGRGDLILSDTVLFELKRALTSASADRAVGQVWKYSDVWKHGPVLLLLCESRQDFHDSMLARHVMQLRQQGHHILCVAAGRRIA